jgi:iron complex outermembrane recepter protein
MAYTRRSGFLTTVQQAANAGSRYNDAFGQLDASLSFVLTDNFKLTAQALNLTKAVNRLYDGSPDRVSGSQLEDRRFYFGVQANF